jgi:replicative DNA helicase
LPPPLAETIIIRAIYTNPENLVGIAERIDTKDFTFMVYRVIYATIKKLASSQTIVNSESVLAYIQTHYAKYYNDVLQLGGSVWLDSLYDASYKGLTTLDEHVKFVVEQADIRLVDTATKKLQQQLDGGVPYETSVGEFDKAIQGIRLRGKTDDVKPIGHGIKGMLNRIAQQDESILGISIASKFPKTDKMLKRVQNNRVTVILSNFKSGKSTYLLDVGWHIASDLNHAVLFGDTELFEDEFRLRLLAKVTGWPMDYIQGGLWINSPEHVQILKDAAEQIEQVPFYWTNMNHMSKAQIIATVKIAQLKHHIRLFIFDYIKPDVESDEGRIDLQIGAKVDMLKESIAKTCNLPVVTAVQMNGNTGKVANSQEVERLADNVIMLRQTTPDDIEHTIASHILIMKTSRYTPQGQRVPLDIDFGTQKIREM